MRVINNPFSLKVLNQANLSGVEGARKVLLSVGSLREQKDHITLVRAFSQIAKRLPEWDLRIVGEGGMRKIIESEISLLGMQDRIFLKGATSRIHCEYEQAQLCVIPSKYESLGLTTLEALAHGLPVVGFDDCSGTNTLIVSGENGILVSGASERVENLARGLFLLMKDTNARTLLAKRTIPVGREYNISNVVEQWVQLIKETAEKQLN
jgi:glycosyltransferase involved in cell wall biosynthesis